MENNPQMFPSANIDSIKNKLFSSFSARSPNEIQALFRQHDSQERGYVGFETFYSLIKNHFGNLNNFKFLYLFILLSHFFPRPPFYYFS